MLSKIVFICLLFIINVYSQECNVVPSNLPLPLQNLLSLSNTPVVSPSINIKQCGCPETCNCIAGSLIQAPIVPPCGCYNPAIGLQNPIIGVQSCACQNPFGCSCGTPVIGNLCGRSTPTVGIATTCGCSDPPVRIVDGCPRCQPVYSYNLPSIGCPTCGSVGLQCGCGVPSYLPAIGLPACGCAPSVLPCGCGTSIPVPYTLPYGCGSCGALTPCNCGYGCNSCGCGCGVPSCGCSGINSCGCVEVPCGLPKVKTTCTCVTPTVETPCGCAQGKPTCACTTTVELPTCGVPVLPPFSPVLGCSRYLRQVVVQPPFL